MLGDQTGLGVDRDDEGNLRQVWAALQQLMPRVSGGVRGLHQLPLGQLGKM